MQIINEVKQRAQHLLEENSATLLTAGGVVGTVATAVLAAKAGFKTSDALRSAQAQKQIEEVRSDPDELREVERIVLSKQEKALIAAPYFLPPFVTGSATITAIVFSHRMSAQKAAALAAAYGLSQKQFEEYKIKAAEKLGINKEQKLQDELAQERVKNTPGAGQIVVVEGEVLCFDQPTGRYFRSTMDTINKAVNATNAEIIHHDHASASFFYEELGLPATSWTDEVGWNTDQLLELRFSTVLSEDDKPCIAIDFGTLPKSEYIPRHY